MPEENGIVPESSSKATAKQKREVRFIYNTSSRTLALIKQAYIDLVKENNGAIPTYEDIGKKVGLSKRQIQKYVKNIDFLSEYNELFKIFAPEIAHAMLAKARKGDTAAAKFFAQLVLGWREKSEYDVKSGGNELPVPQIILNYTHPKDEPPV